MKSLLKKGDFDFLKVLFIILVIDFAVLKDSIISYFTFKEPLILAYCDNMFSSLSLLWVFLSAAIMLVVISKASAFLNWKNSTKKDKLKARLIVYPIFVAVICSVVLFTYFGCNAKTILYSDTTIKNYNIFGKTDLEFNCNDNTVYVKITPEYTGGRGGSYNGAFRIIYKDNEIILNSADFKSDEAIKEFTDSLKNEPIIEVPYEFKESFEDTSPNKHQQFLYDTYFKKTIKN